MIDLYTWTTPNGRKASIMLEELGAEYTAHPINIMKDDQFAPDFLKISPNNKIPAIVDRSTGRSVMESGAILLYLAEKHGRFLPAGEKRWEVMEWLMWQMGGFGPMLGQAHHFLHFNKGVSDYAENRYGKEAKRLYGVLDKRLEGREFVVDEYSIADIAIWPWSVTHRWQGVDLNEFPNVKRWYETIRARPAAQKGFHVPKEGDPIPAA